MERQIEAITNHLHRMTRVSPFRVNGGWRALCPIHDDQQMDLSIQWKGNDSWQLQCAAGCTEQAILRAMQNTYTRPAKDSTDGQPIVTPGLSPHLLATCFPGKVPSTAVIARLHESESTFMRWLWPGRIPLGKLTLFVGDPGLGKSIVTLDVAARVSRGREMPQLEGEFAESPSSPASVVLLSAEDAISDTIRPRLVAAGADLERIVVLEAVRDPATNCKSSLSLDRDLDVLENVVGSLDNCRLVVIDPVIAYLGRRDSYRNADMRSLFSPLSDFAERTGVAVLAINHLNKLGRGPALYRSMGSLAFAAASRSVLAVLADPQEPADRLLISIKNNVAEWSDGFRFRVENCAASESTEPHAPVVAWQDSGVTLSADDILLASTQSAGFTPAIDEAAEWLQSALETGPQRAVELKSQAKRDGIENRTLTRAKARLGVASYRLGIGRNSGWYWKLPGSDSAEPAVETGPEMDVDRIMETLESTVAGTTV
jgi:putative DNA primase/helicase